MTLFNEQAGQLGRFVGCDRPGHAEHDCPGAAAKRQNLSRSLVRFSSGGPFHWLARQLTLVQSPAQIALGPHYVPELLQVFLLGLTDDGVAIIAPVLHFVRGRGKT